MMMKTVLLLCFLATCTFAAPLTTGNAQLRDAVNAALAEIFVNKEWAPIATAYNVGLRAQDCVSSTDFFPYPKTPTGTLQNVLSTTTLKLAVSFTNVPVSYSNDGTNVQGFEKDLWTKVAQHLATHYNTGTINIVWTNSDPSGSDFFDLVKDGTVDAFVGAIIPGQYNTTTTSTEVGNMACSHLTLSGVGLLSSSHSSQVTWSDINSPSFKVGSLAASTTLRSIVTASAPNADVSFQYANYSALYAALNDSTIDMALGYGPTSEYYRTNILSYGSNLLTFNLGQGFMRGLLTRRDAAQTPAPSRLAAVDGNQQLAQAFQASLANQYQTGYWNQLATQYGIPERIQDCAPNSNFYPYPSASNLLPGTLKSVLQNKNITFCFNNLYPYLLVNSSGTFGLYADVARRFVQDLQTQYSVSGITLNFIYSTPVPTFKDVFDLNCHGYIGSVTPGNLGNLSNEGFPYPGFTTTSQRLYQSCSINADAVVVIAGPTYVGTFDLPTLAGLNIAIGSVNASGSSRNYVRNYLPNLNYNYNSYYNYEELFAALANGATISLGVGQYLTATDYIANHGLTGFQVLTLYDQILYSASFYKPAPEISTTTTSASTSADSTTTSDTSSASILAAGSLLLFSLLALF